MWNAKCEITGHVKKIMLQCKQLLNSLAFQLKTLNSQNAQFFFLLISHKFFTKSKNSAAKTLCGGVVALKIPKKTKLRQLILQCCKLQDSNFNGTGLHQGDLLEKFKSRKFFANVSLLKLLTKENLLVCFH